MANTVSFKIKIDDSGTFKTVTADAGELGKVIDEVKVKAIELNKQIVESASYSQIIEGARNAVSQLASALDSLSQAYYEDEEAANTLAKVMSNTMEATADEVEEIKRFIDAQEKVGVVSGGVQTAAARELSTYLTLTSSLKTLIPVLNDMGVHQYGVGVSAEQLTQIATMMGKVMDGQVEALSRAGYKFDEAQKYILKFGEESERAAVLAQVVSESVGGINASSANTAAGQMQQLRNQMEGAKSAIGSIVSAINPFIQSFAGIVIIVANVTQLQQSIKSLSLTMAITKGQSLALATAERLQATACKILGVSALEAKTATGLLKAEIIATEAALTLGLSIAISAVIEGLSRLIGRAGEAGDGIDGVSSAEEAYRQAASQARAETSADIVALEELIKKKKNEGEKVDELNRKYGEALGTYSTAAEWYDVLVSKSADYCKQLGYQAKAHELAVQAGNKQVELDGILDKMRQMRESGSAYKRNGSETREYKNLREQGKALNTEVQDLTAQFQDCTVKAQDASAAMAGSIEAAGKSWKEMNLDDLNKAIDVQEKKVKSLAGTEEKAAAKTEAAILRQMKLRKSSLEKAYGLESSGTDRKDRYNGDSFIDNASTYEEIGNNIKYYQNQIKKANISDTESIRVLNEKIAVLQAEQKAMDDMAAAAAAAAYNPAEIKSLDDIDRAIKYQQSLRASATEQNIAGIDAEIARLNTLKTKFEYSYIASLPDELVSTYQEVNDKISLYNILMQDASSEDRIRYQQSIDKLELIKKGWDDVLAVATKPADISQLNNIEKLDEAITYYEAIRKKASADEIEEVQATIKALEDKKNLLEGIASIPGMEVELSNLSGLSGKKLKMELELLGLDGIKTKIRELQKLLDDTKNPLNASQRAEVEQLMASYQAYNNILEKSNVTFRKGWGAVAGMGDSVMNLTELLKGDGDAWQKVSGVIDNFLTMYESFSTIIEIVKALIAVTNAQTLAEKAKGAATVTTASQTASAAATIVAADTAETVAERAKANAAEGSAAAQTMSAHAGIPFVGIAIAAAMVATMVGVLMSLPKFANGGIAYGPTLGLFGEYSGAANNPEVVAPLNKLRELIGSDGAGFGEVKFVIKGRQLEGILSKMNRINGRTE